MSGAVAVVWRRRRGQELIPSESPYSRTLRDTSNPFCIQESVFMGRYRLSREMVFGLLDKIKPHFTHDIRSHRIAPELKVLTALHFYGHGSDQKSVAADLGISQTAVCRCIKEVTMAINEAEILNQGISFPGSSQRRAIVDKTFRKFHLPNVLGFVDGTHVSIVAPREREEIFVNRKFTHSLNVQIACDMNLYIININAKYPGSSHDAFIWRNSTLREKMVELYESGERYCLLGDSGYPNECWLLTPILNVQPSSPEGIYTALHIRARNCVERCIGVLKARFRCLLKHRVLEYAPIKSGLIVNACAFLHNMCVRAQMPLEFNPEIDAEDEHFPVEVNAQRDAALEVRRSVVQFVNRN